MRKLLIVAIGIMSLSVLETPQPASAGWVKRKVCDTVFLPTDAPRQHANKCFTGNGDKYHCTVDLMNGGFGLRRCHDVDVLVPDDWKGASANGVNKTSAPSTNLKQK